MIRFGISWYNYIKSVCEKNWPSSIEHNVSRVLSPSLSLYLSFSYNLLSFKISPPIGILCTHRIGSQEKGREEEKNQTRNETKVTKSKQWHQIDTVDNSLMDSTIHFLSLSLAVFLFWSIERKERGRNWNKCITFLVIRFRPIVYQE